MPPQKKPNNMQKPAATFPPYYQPIVVEQRLEDGLLMEGVLRINPRKYEDAYISDPDGFNDIIIEGVLNRCRALQDDVVVVDVNEQKKWRVLHDKIQDFLEQQGSEEDVTILMQGAKVNESAVQTKPEPEILSIESKPSTSSNCDLVLPEKVEVPEIKTEQSTLDKSWGQQPIPSAGKAWPVHELPAQGFSLPVVIDGACIEVVSVGDQPPRQTRRGKRGGKKKKVVSPEEMNEGYYDPSLGLNQANAPPAVVENDSKDGDSEKENEIEMSEVKKEIELVEESLSESVKESMAASDDDPDVIVEAIDGQVPDQKVQSKKRRRGKRGKKKTKATAAEGQVPNNQLKTPHRENDQQNPKKTSQRPAAENDKQSPKKPAQRKANKTPKRQPEAAKTPSGPKKKKRYIPPTEFLLASVLQHPEWKRFVQRTGRVVFIKEEKHSRCAAGNLKLLADKNPNFALFSPTDCRVPRMKIPRDQCPETFFDRPEDFKGMLFVAQIVKWDQVSSAMGKLVRCIGDGADIEVKTEGMLIEHQIDDSDFSDAVTACLPALPFTIPEEEFSKRRDFRKECVFTIDPMTARDLDDAVSIERLPDGRLRVGVHIADVAYFIPEGSELDRVAANRATSVYLVQKVVPMLPRPLCEHLCSLNPGEDRLTFSVEWIMTEEGKIEEEWFGRSAIRSAVKLAYEHAQGMLDEPDREWTTLPPIEEPWNAWVISEKVNLLNRLAVNLRTKRETDGALRLDQPKLCFALDKESGLPIGYKLYEHKHSNRLIEEFMLLANMAVAHKIFNAFPTLAVLRRHPPPKEAMMDCLIAQLEVMGIRLDATTSKSLQESLKEYLGTDERSKQIFMALMNMCSKPMELARYFCTGTLPDREHFRHYALNVPLYTHFTSPIRRYPDVLVHRLLDAAVRNEKPGGWKTANVEKMMQQCNDRRLAAKRVGETSADLFLALFIRESGPVPTKGMVISIMDHSFDCLILEMATVKRVYTDRLEGLVRFSYSRPRGVPEMILRWKPTEADPEMKVQAITMFTPVELELRKHEENPHDFVAVVTRPSE